MKQPTLIIPQSLDVMQAVKKRLKNGVEIYTLSSDEFEVLRFSFVFRAGSATQNIPFSASTTVNMLAEGSRDMNAQQIAEQLDYYGSYFDVSTDRDLVYVSFASLSKFFTQTLDVARQVILHPTFPEQELESYCAKSRQRLEIERAKIETKAREEFARAMFGAEHPYGTSSNENDYLKLTRKDVVDFYNTHYTAQNCFVVCSGRVGEQEQLALEQLAEQLREAPETIKRVFPTPKTIHRSFVEQAGAVQSSIRVGRVLFSREHPDFLGMQVLATALGGYFGSRLMQNLREERGFTYGVGALMVNFEHEGYLAVVTQVGLEVTDQAMEQIYLEIERMRKEAMAVEELNLVKNIMVGEMMRILDGPFGIADVTIENILCGADNHIIEQNILEIRAMTPSDIQNLAIKYLDPKDLVTVVAGAKLPEGW